MKKKLLLLIKKHNDTLIEQTKRRSQETLEIKLNKQMQAFSFSPSIKSVEEAEELRVVRSFDATKSVFNITNGNNSFKSLH